MTTVVQEMSAERAEALVVDLGSLLVRMSASALEVSECAREALPILDEIYRSSGWTALGFDSFDALIADRFPALRALGRDERGLIMAALAEAGWSTRAIGTTLGVHQSTVVRSRSTDASASVTGLDGKVRKRVTKRRIVAEETVTETEIPTSVPVEIPDTPESRVYQITQTWINARRANGSRIEEPEALALLAVMNELVAPGVSVEMVCEDAPASSRSSRRRRTVLEGA